MVSGAHGGVVVRRHLLVLLHVLAYRASSIALPLIGGLSLSAGGTADNLCDLLHSV